MKLSDDGLIPQVEPEGGVENALVRMGGAKRLLQRSSFPMQSFVMFNTSVTVWVTSPTVRSWFMNDIRLFVATVALGFMVWFLADWALLIPGEQAWNQGQSQRSERSPLKRDTEAIRERLEQMEEQLEGDN